MAEDPQPMTLQQRIAALNAAHIGRIPGDPPPPTRPQPQVPTRRPVVTKQHTINIPHEQVNGSVTERKVGNQPNGPPPLPGRRAPPPLPSRKSSDEQSRRTSVTSTTSTNTNTSSEHPLTATRTRSQDGGRIKAPAWGEGELPPLPVRPAEGAKKVTQIPQRPRPANRMPSGTQTTIVNSNTKDSQPAARPSLPPRLPSRQPLQDVREKSPTPPSRRIPPIPSTAFLEKAKKSSFSLSANGGRHELSESAEHNQRPVAREPASTLPPPVPLSSRPDLNALRATNSPPASANLANGNYQVTKPTYTTGCMTCRDFSGPDQHASLFPRQQVTSLQTLAQQLTSPFQSPTDKARAIFAWLHYNIYYDVDNFFRGTIKGSTPQSTLQTGMAVCEGYAALYTNLATYAGLESVVVGGHGKGFGYANLAPGSPLPPFEGNHAWNAVKIDNGEWKLIDPCWGAGHVQGKGMPYMPQFNPLMFTMSNEEFGIKHFPSNKNQFFLPGGRQMTWEEYIQINADRWPYECEPPTVFTNAKTDYSIGERTVLPRDRRIRVNTNGIVRFQFGLFCEHWTLEHHTKKGRPPVFMLAIHGVDGRNKDHVPLEHVRGSTPGGGGDLWYVDVMARELGAPGQTITLFAVTSFGDRQDARGLTVREFKEGKGRVGMGFTGIAAWDLV